MDTIFALATAPGRAGIAVLRISGPAAHSAAAALAGELPQHGRSLRTLRDPSGEALDQALVLTFAPQRSFTGEAVVELHCHGAPAVVAAILRTLASQPGLRSAEAGEFTRRALENGRLDLAQVEGLADLLSAETEGQRRQAMRVFAGALGRKAEEWRARLLRAVALVEATIDFSDEDVPEDVWPEVLELVVLLEEELRTEAQGARIAERLREGFEVAIVGAPNVGKSTLLNRLAGREAAITSEIAGTTRDVIEVRMDLSGLPVTLIDTAGLREAQDPIEAIGIERARARAAMADLRVHLHLAGETAPEPGPDDLVVLAKADLATGPGLAISGRTGDGIDALVAEIGRRLSDRTTGLGVGLRERHARAMLDAANLLDETRALIDIGAAVEIVAETLRRALRQLDALVGRVGVEDILGEIFSSFCIGK
ncbi:tRNA uridine-5-carboxymethylaminomethyl(34) synthesis GTPase MnmE [Rubellimicrobium rubrum]|uniref:tRNA modification GTPase MnmE n=1 Tax=Rubellimicrobium rubrum TaxID=2585369 RepID=A0A5C4MW94_9RHOB|nr:tRNA uridine-5-carboxymethylaminomethyl(34) synthesis GTPase MnmE [Rubellimicrobium rubrum]TNC48160.1 tRNA uridine-5-carboxymethylaminomethyl(34) synthesis GTPase MnmE [Rubellimicrobium rubrum]